MMELVKTRGENEVVVAAIGTPPPYRQRMYRFIQDSGYEMALEIRRPDQSVYGVLMPKSQFKFVVICIPEGNEDHQTLMTIALDPQKLTVDVTTGDDVKVAEVKKSESKLGKLLITIMKGADAGLTLACMLAALLPSVDSPPPPSKHHAADLFVG